MKSLQKAGFFYVSPSVIAGLKNLIYISHLRTSTMFNEHEIATFLDDPEVYKVLVDKKRLFLSKEARFLEINEHDFLSLIMMTPSVGMAKCSGTVSLFEELALNKRARKMSRGGYFLIKDPVAHAMKYLIKNYSKWEEHFFEVIILCMNKTIDLEELSKIEASKKSEDPVHNFTRHLMDIPYGFVKFLSSFFLQDENDLVQAKVVSEVSYNKVQDMAKMLKIEKLPVFQSFLKTFIPK